MIKDLEAALGYKFQNITLLQNALTHSSYANERWHNSLKSNERLEFLGDSILGMVVAEYLYKNFPDRPEGELTRMRADMVCEQTLAAAANRIGIGDHLLLGHGEEQGGGTNITIEGFVSPKPSPIRICEGKYLLPVADVIAATITVGALALKSSACTTSTGRYPFCIEPVFSPKS